jgi:hypothetical protein
MPSFGGLDSPFLLWVLWTGGLVLSGFVVYRLRQRRERKKLLSALKEEVRAMNAIDDCSDYVSGLNKPPPNQRLNPSDVPSSSSIPTLVYQENIDRLGLLKTEDLNGVVNFYTKVMYTKQLMDKIRGDTEAPIDDHETLVDSIKEIDRERNELFGENWMDDGEGGKDLFPL